MESQVDHKAKVELKVAVKGISAGKRGYGFGKAKVALTQMKPQQYAQRRRSSY